MAGRSIEDAKIYIGDRLVKSVFIGDKKVKYGKTENNRGMQIRYIREHLSHSVMPNGQEDVVRTFIEVEAIDHEGINVARGKSVTVQPGYTVYGGTGSEATLTNGNKAQYFSLTPQDKRPAWCQIDLGEIHEIDAINTWHYPDKRKFYTKIEVSADGTKWTVIFDSNVDGLYEETSAGKTHALLNTVWQWPKNGFRYVRDYLKGNSDISYGKEKHWLEIQVADKNDFNLAQGRPVSWTPGYTKNAGCGDYSVVTDGISVISNTKDYLQLLPSDDNWVYVEVDLGKVVKGKNIKRWHYNKANWKYRSKVMVSEDGVKWYKVFDTLFDGDYVDAADGHTLVTPYTDLFEFKLEGIRYIRDWLKNSNRDAYRCWTEIAAYNGSNVNVALGKNVTIAPGYRITSGGVIEEIVDNKLDRWIDIGPMNNQFAYLEVDLGQTYMDIQRVTTWHDNNWFGKEVRYVNRTEVSSDGIHWFTLYDSDRDGSYAESSQGHSMIVPYSDATITPINFFHYPNYSTANNEYEVFYSTISDVPVVNTILRKSANYLMDIGLGNSIKRDVLNSAMDYIGGSILIKVRGTDLAANWGTLNTPEKEDKIDAWFVSYIVNTST